MSKKKNLTPENTPVTPKEITQNPATEMSKPSKKSRLPQPRTRYRMFCVELYCTPDRWERVLSNVDHYAWILHDKDVTKEGKPKTPHYHLLLEYSNNRTWSAVLKEFNLEGLTENTTINCQVGGNRTALAEYLIHRTAKAHEDGKHEYDINEVHTDSLVWWYEEKRYDPEKEHDNFIDDLLEGDYTHREMAYKYGRDYIKNAHTYQSFKREIVAQERAIERKAFVKALHESLDDLVDGQNVTLDPDVKDFIMTDNYIPHLLTYRVKETAHRAKYDPRYVLSQMMDDIYNRVLDMLAEENEI